MDENDVKIHKEAAKDYEELHKQEMEMFHKWKQSPTPINFQKLYESFKPLIFDASKKFSTGSTLPPMAHKAFAAQNFLNALNTFKPAKGAKLKSWVHTYVSEKGKRLNYMYSNLGSIPEPRITKITVFNNVQQMLKDQLGRDPSTFELSDELGWSHKDVELLRKELRKDLLEDEKMEMHIYKQPEKQREFIEFLQYELTPEELTVYEHIFGLNGKKLLVKANNEPDIGRIAKEMFISEAKVRQLKGRIANKVKEYQKSGQFV